MKKLFVLFLLFPLLTFSQSNKVSKILKKLEFKVRNFDSSQPIMIDRLSDDITDLSGEFENSFFMEGFNVISNKVASEIVEFNNPLNQNNESIKIQKYTEVKSVYVLTISGKVRADTGCGGVVPSSITGRIVDMLNEGSLVGTFRFSQSMWEGKCASDIAEAVAIKLKSISN